MFRSAGTTLLIQQRRRLVGTAATPTTSSSYAHLSRALGRTSSSMTSAASRAIQKTKAGASSSGLRSKSTTTSTTPSPLEADAGNMGTKVHHTLAHSMAILAPLYFFLPDSYTDSAVHKTMGVLLGANMGMHAWIGLNYVATDYVPKVSKALLGPARYVTAGVAVTILLGTVKIAAFSPGGIKGVVKGVWNGKPKDKFDF